MPAQASQGYNEISIVSRLRGNATTLDSNEYRISSAPTAANKPQQQQQQNGANKKQQAASIQHQQACKQQAAGIQQHQACKQQAAATSKQPSQEPGADEMPAAAAAAATKQQQQQVPRRRRVELNPARGGGYSPDLTALRSWAPTLLAKARQTPASYS